MKKTWVNFVDVQALVIGGLVFAVVAPIAGIAKAGWIAFFIVQFRIITHYIDKRKQDAAYGIGHRPNLYLLNNEITWASICLLAQAISWIRFSV